MGFGIEDLKSAGVVATGAPATQTSTPATSTPSSTTRVDSEAGSDEGYDTSGLEDDTGSQGPSQAEIEAQKNQAAYDEASKELQAALSKFGVENSTSSDYESVQAQIDELRQLGSANGVTTDGTAEEGDSTIQQTDAKLAMKKEEYDNFVNQLEALQNGDLTKDMNSFGELAQQFNSLSSTLDSSTEGYNADLLENTGDLVFFTEEDYSKIQNAMGAAMAQTMENSVNELYESNDYKILTGEVAATDEQKQQARANFEARKTAITETGTAFGELGLELPDSCQITTVVNWGSEAQEGDKVANDCMDRIIQNYLAKNHLEGKLQPSEAYEMIMQLNPDIYETINSGETIYAGQQFLMPDASAIKNQESVKAQILEEAISADSNGELAKVLSEYGDNADYNFNGKTNTVNVINKETGEVYTAKLEYNEEEGGYRVVSAKTKEGENPEETQVTRESIDSSMEDALSKIGIEGANQVEGRFTTGKTTGSGNFENVYSYTYENEDGEEVEGKVKVQYDPETGKTTMNYITGEEEVKDDNGNVVSYNYQTSGDVVYDENEQSLSYLMEEDDGNYTQYKDYYDDNGNIISTDKYNSDGTIASTTTGEGDDAVTAEYSYGSSGRVESVTVGDKTYSIQDIQKENEGLSSYDAVDVLKQVAKGTSYENAVKNVQNGEYSNAPEGKTVTMTEEDLEQFNNIASELRSDFPSEGIEFKKNSNGTYSGEYKVVENIGGDTIESTCKVSYDPETGKTTMKYYPDEIKDGKESSIIEYDPATKTKTSDFSDGSSSTEVYADEVPSQENLLRSAYNSKNSSSVTTYNNGEITGRFNAQYNDNKEITKFTVTDMNGVSTSLSQKELETLASESGVSQDALNNIISDIQNGKAAKEAFSSGEGKAIINAMNEKSNDTLVLSSKSTQSEKEAQVDDFQTAIEEFMPELEGFETDGTISEDGKMTFTKKAEGEDGKDVTYTAVKNDDGTVTFTSEDEKTSITVDSENATKETVTKEDDKTTTEFTKFTYSTPDENGNFETFSDTVKYEENAEGEIQSMTVNGKTFELSELPENFDVNNLKGELKTLKDGTKSPSSILSNAFGKNIEGSTSVNDGVNKTEQTEFNLDDMNEAMLDGNLLNYLKDNVSYENIGAILSEMEDGNWVISYDINSISTPNSYEALDYLADVFTSALSEGNVEELKENGQYDAIIQTLANDTWTEYGILNHIAANEDGISGEVVADILLKANGGDVENYNTMLNSLTSSSKDTQKVFSNALIEMAASGNDNKISGDVTYSEYAQKLLSSYMQNNLTFSNDVEGQKEFIDNIIAADDTGALMVSIGGQMSVDGQSAFDIFQNDKEYCDKIANAYVTAYNSGLGYEWQEYIEEQLSNEIYDAMKGLGSRENIVKAIFEDYQNKTELLKGIERHFNSQAGEAHGGHYSTLYKYMHDQWKLKDFAEELKEKGIFDNTDNEVNKD